MNRDVITSFNSTTSTPGTVINIEGLEKSKNNYLMAICEFNNKSFGIAVVDTTTGEFKTTEFENRTDLDIVSEVSKFEKLFSNKRI